MRPTRASTLLSIAIVAGVAGFALDAILVSRQLPVLVMATALGVTLAIVGVAVVFMAVPVRRHVKGTAMQRVDPLYAARVVYLAKASSITGSLLGSFALGGLVYLLTRAVIPGAGSSVPNAFAVVGGVILTACALVAEHMCIAPPPDDDDDRPHRGGGPDVGVL